MKVGVCVAELLNVKKIKMLRIISTLNVKSNQGRNLKLSSWHDIERKRYILESQMGITI